jgi:hypothetical protein
VAGRVGSATALICVRQGPIPAYKQIEVCLAHALERGWRVSIVPAGAWRQAVSLIRDAQGSGQHSVLLMAYRDDGAEQIVRAVEDVGGVVEFCHPERLRAPPVLPGHDTDEIVIRMHERGGTTAEIVRLLGVAEGRVRAILGRVRRR